MKTKSVNGRIEVVDQTPCMIPDLTIKDLLSVIPEHCFQRSAFKSSLYVAWDFFLITCIYKAATYADSLITPEHLSLSSPYLYSLARFALWAFYAFANGLVMTGLWVVAHECGHQAYSESKAINNTVGWILHSGLGVPYHSWRISHAKHHASTGHMTQDQVFVPKTRSQLGLPALKQKEELLDGSSVSEAVAKELWDALGDSPVGATIGFMSYLLLGWPLYLGINASGQLRYPSKTNHFNPNANSLFAPHHFMQVIVSDIGVIVWMAAVGAAIYNFGFFNTFRVYLAPYLWVNHWLILITFLQHTDPLLPHYHASQFTFPRGALSTLDRNLLGDLGSFMGWIGACATHGISETHVAHHVSSKIPHYNAWEANAALHKRLKKAGIHLQGAPGGWAEMYRVFRECKFVEDEGDILFYKNAKGLAATRPVFANQDANDSGVEVDSVKTK